jgi:hypothetical protein
VLADTFNPKPQAKKKGKNSRNIVLVHSSSGVCVYRSMQWGRCGRSSAGSPCGTHNGLTHSGAVVRTSTLLRCECLAGHWLITSGGGQQADAHTSTPGSAPREGSCLG